MSELIAFLDSWHPITLLLVVTGVMVAIPVIACCIGLVCEWAERR